MSASRAVLFSIVLSSVSGVALAQQAGPAPGGSAGDQGRWDRSDMREEHAEARHAERAKALHDVLGIQPSQESAFAAFTASMHPPIGDQDGGRSRGPRDGAVDAGMSMTTPQRLDRMKAEMDRRFAAMRDAFDRRAEATKTLYAALDPHQRTVMDALPELSGHHGGMDHGGQMDHKGPMGAGM